MHNLSRAALMLSALVVAGLARTSLAQQASGSLDPTRRGGCPSDGGPPGDAQKVPGGTQRGRDRGGVVEACQTGGAPRLDPGNFPDGVLPANVPPPARENHPPVQSSHSDSAPRCSGNRATTEQFVDADPPYQGWGWFQHSRPELAVDDAEDPAMLRIYLGRSDVLDFSLVGGSSPQVFVGVNGVQGVVARLPGTSTEPELYVHYDDRGNVFTYFGHHVPSGAVDMHGAKGQHWKTQSADAGGGAATFYVGHATDPAEALLDGFVLDEGDPTARCKAAVDGAGRTWEYTYGTVVGAQPMLTKIEIEDERQDLRLHEPRAAGEGAPGDPHRLPRLVRHGPDELFVHVLLGGLVLGRQVRRSDAALPRGRGYLGPEHGDDGVLPGRPRLPGLHTGRRRGVHVQHVWRRRAGDQARVEREHERR